MMEFAGFDMPVQYSGIVDEHMAVRQTAGLFDVSHMGEVFVSGPKAGLFVQHLITNDASRLGDGHALYTVMCNDQGGVLDDLLVYRLKKDAYLLVINAANIEKDYAWMCVHNPMGAEVYNVSHLMALVALQGPRSLQIAAQITDLPVHEIPYYQFLQPAPGRFMGFNKVMLSRTGYTGETGLEIYCESENAPALWDAIIAAGQPLGLKPAGLGARDTLRLEAGYCLYGRELTENTNPYEARLGWLTKLEKGDFIGRSALAAVKAARPARMLVGLVLQERGIPRAGYTVTDENGESIGVVTSGTQSPMLECGIALAYIPNAKMYTAPDSMLGIQIRSRVLPARVVRPPFHT